MTVTLWPKYKNKSFDQIQYQTITTLCVGQVQNAVQKV